MLTLNIITAMSTAIFTIDAVDISFFSELSYKSIEPFIVIFIETAQTSF